MAWTTTIKMGRLWNNLKKNKDTMYDVLSNSFRLQIWVKYEFGDLELHICLPPCGQCLQVGVKVFKKMMQLRMLFLWDLIKLLANWFSVSHINIEFYEVGLRWHVSKHRGKRQKKARQFIFLSLDPSVLYHLDHLLTAQHLLLLMEKKYIIGATKDTGFSVTPGWGK